MWHERYSPGGTPGTAEGRVRQREEASNLGEWEEKGTRTHTGDPGE